MIEAAELAACLRTLAYLTENPAVADQHNELGQALARAYKRIRKQRRIDAEIARRAYEDPAQLPRKAEPSRYCYICRAAVELGAADYTLLCLDCAQKNRTRRNRRANLSGRTALVTGGRIKIGYQTVLKLLRDGAMVIVTSRFPTDAARRYANEPDFDQWKDRLSLYPLDLRNIPAVHALTDHLQATLSGLDILINNAAQTIRRPAEAFQQLLELEARSSHQLPSPQQRMRNAETEALTTLSIVRDQSLSLTHDESVQNSWLLPMEEVSTGELAEVMVINAMAPFVLCSRLEPLMRRSPFKDRYIVNVTSAEGQFSRDGKTPQHPHTNMAKASLNMLTRTAAARCAESGIYMNSVDPGWITHMVAVDPSNPEDESSPAADFVPPLDSTDGAARIYDPIIQGIEGVPVWGQLLKDYECVPW